MKKALSVLLALLVLLSLTACNRGSNNTGTTSANGTGLITTKSSNAATSASSTTEPAKTQASGDKLPNVDKDKVPSATTEPAAQEKPDEPAVRPLQVMIGEHFDSEGEFQTENGFSPLCSAEWNSLTLSKECAAEFPELSSILRELAVEDFANYADIVAELLPSAKEMAAEESGYFKGFTINTACFVQRADDRILSVQVNFDAYTGEAHSNYWVNGMNLEPATGEWLELSDVLTDTEELPSILSEKIKAKYDSEPFDNVQDMLEEYVEADYTWTLDYEGITFYFSPYEIASYAAGLLKATIRFDEMPELFRDAYTVKPEGGWAKMLPVYEDIEVDLNRDAEGTDILYISPVEDEYGEFSLYVTKNEREFKLNEYIGYAVKPLLVCLGAPGNERYFLYAEGTSANDYATVYIYDLNGDEIALTSELSGAGFAGVWDESLGEYGTWYENVLTDPTEIELASIIYQLGTWTAYRIYTPDFADGTLHPQTAYYLLPEDVEPIVSAVDLEVTMLPGKKKETLPAGTNFWFRRTDGESYAECELEDGRECRIEIVHEDYTPTINGIPEWDCFENLMYAG